jgi:hypothetical protein
VLGNLACFPALGGAAEGVADRGAGKTADGAVDELSSIQAARS